MEKRTGLGLFGAQARPPRAKMKRMSRAELWVRSSPLYLPKPAEVVSGAAVHTFPNLAQESQDDLSSQANSLKLFHSARD